MLDPYTVLADLDRADFGETNCACPDDGGVLCIRAIPSSDLSLWCTAPELLTQELRDGYAALFNPTGRASIVVLGPRARSLLESFRTPRPLVPGGQDVNTQKLHTASRLLAELELLQPFPVDERPQFPAQPRTLTVWLHVTNACNLRCTYCYVNKSPEHMDEETGLRAVDAAFRSARRNGFPRVKLKYAGGEATLNARLIATLHTHAQRIAEETGIDLEEVVLSNGVGLGPRFLRFLRDAHIGLMISLDGVGPDHDRQRPFVNGHGSFLHVVRTLDRAAKLGLQPFLSITVTAANADRLRDVVAFALDRGLRFNLNFYRDHLADMAPSAMRAEQDQLITGMRKAFQVIEARMPRMRMIDLLVDRSSFRAPHEHACGVGSSYLVVDQRGGVAACQMEIERTVTDVAAVDPLAELRRNEIPLTNPSVLEKEGCEACTWRFWCAGGCPLLTLRATGRTDIKSPYCEVYQALYPELIRLEGLRLLKWGRPMTQGRFTGARGGRHPLRLRPSSTRPPHTADADLAPS